MKLKLQQIVDAMPAMAVFAQKELPAKAAYRAAKLARKMNAAHRDYEKVRGDLVRRYGERSAPGKAWRVKPENTEAFQAELQAMLDQEVELEGVAKIPFADIEQLELAPAVLADLEPFIEEPKD